MSDKPLVNRRIRTRLLLAFVAVTSVPLVVTAVYATRTHVAAIARLTREEATREAGLKAAELRERLALHRAELAEIAGLPLTLRLLEAARWDGAKAENMPAQENAISESAHGESGLEFWQVKMVRRLTTAAAMWPEVVSLFCQNDVSQPLAGVERVGSRLLAMSGSGEGDERIAAANESVAQGSMTISENGKRLVLWEDVTGDGTAVQGRLVLRLSIDSLLSELGEGSWVLGLEGGNPLADARGSDVEDSVVGSRDTVGDKASMPLADARGSDDGDEVGVEGIVVWAPIGVGDLMLGEVVSDDVLAESVNSFRRTFGLVLFGGLLLAVGLGVWLSRQLTEPVRGLLASVRRVGRGDLDVAIRDETGDELGALADGLNRMTVELRGLHEDFERRLEEKAAALVHAERLATVGRTAASVAHEINNPSGIIALYAQLLKEQTPADDPRLEKLDVIESKAREVSEIVRDLLDYARKPALHWSRFSAADMVRDAVDSALAAGDLPVGREAVSTDVRVDWLAGDRAQLRRVVRNLVTNGLHAMSPGDTMTIVARRGDGGEDVVVLEVRDTGAGIEADHLASIFEPFYTTKQYGSGTGLGLAISKEIVERHGGRIEIESILGVGTTARVVLPVDGDI